MGDADDKERRGLYVDKTARITTSIGFLGAAVLAVVWIVVWGGDMQNIDTVHDSRLSRLEDRFETYIGRRNMQHGDFETTDAELERAIQVIREQWAAKHGGTLP